MIMSITEAIKSFLKEYYKDIIREYAQNQYHSFYNKKKHNYIMGRISKNFWNKHKIAVETFEQMKKRKKILIRSLYIFCDRVSFNLL